MKLFVVYIVTGFYFARSFFWSFSKLLSVENWDSFERDQSGLSNIVCVIDIGGYEAVGE